MFASDRVAEPYYDNPDADVYTVPAGGGAIAKVIDIDGPIRGAVPSPDGQTYAFAGWINPAHRQSYTQTGLFLYRHGAVEPLTHGGDAEVGSALTGDQHPPRGGGANPLVWAGRRAERRVGHDRARAVEPDPLRHRVGARRLTDDGCTRRHRVHGDA